MAAFDLPKLNRLPTAWRALITCFMIFLGAGYFVAQLNVLYQNEMTDGEPGLSFLDLKLRYHGGMVQRTEGKALPSRMLEMIGSAMRQYFDEDAHYEVLSSWLAGGATEEGFTTGEEPTPFDVIFSDCMRCHAADSNEDPGAESPFGPDLFSVEYEAVSKFTLAGEPDQSEVWRPPTSRRDLAMTSHVHVFGVPTFLAIQSMLFLWAAGSKGKWRTFLACGPLAFFFIDLACWWLARIPVIGVAFVALITVSAALFGLTFLIQWVVVMVSIWRRPMPHPETPKA